MEVKLRYKIQSIEISWVAYRLDLDIEFHAVNGEGKSQDKFLEIGIPDKYSNDPVVVIVDIMTLYKYATSITM
jgi:hypothetical protein